MEKKSLILSTTITPEIACLTLNRAEKRNAMNQRMIQQLLDALEEVAVDKNIRVLLLNGEGEHFCAGADINTMQAVAKNSYEDNVADAQQLALLLNTLHTFPKPTIVLAHGITMGGGLGLIASCDIAIGSHSSQFCFPEVKIGLTPSVISPYIIAALGARITRYYFLTAAKFNAEEAKRIALLHELCPDNELKSTGIKLAEALLQNGPQALTEAKNLIATVTGVEISEEVMQFTAEHLAAMRSTAEAQEGLRAFLEKKEAKWK